MQQVFRLAAVLLVAILLKACAAEVGSERWCEGMKEKPKGEWSLNETRDYAEHCLF